MAAFMKGDIVVVPFPFSDLTDANSRIFCLLQAVIALETKAIVLSQSELGFCSSDSLQL
jgi:hypothetical protein